MIVYSGLKKQFIVDSMNGVIAKKVEGLFQSFGLRRESYAEFNSWQSSLPRIALVVGDHRIDDNVQVALEYQIPLTSKRVDFMIGGTDGQRDNIVVVELKQWENCQITSRENIVKTFTGGAEREVVHPSRQVYSYVKLIENFNETVRESNIGLYPCAYLHNFKEENRKNICNPRYQEALDDAPVFLQEDGYSLSDFISAKVQKPSKKNLFEIVEHGKLKHSKSLQSVIGSILNGNKEFELIDEQQVAYATALKRVENSINSDQKHTIIIQGGPGTGKSVIAINLLGKLLSNGFSCAYVTKTSAPRYTFSENLIAGEHTKGYLKGLFKSSGSFFDAPQNSFDCLIADEAHRLMAKSGLYQNLGENQIKEIINASKISVFFIDEDQIVTMKDIGTIAEIKKQAALLGSEVYCPDSLILVSQFRCNGSDGYIAFLNDVLQISETANAYTIGMDYDIRIFNTPCQMREELRKFNTNNKARMIAGYCYPWVSDKDKSLMDIVLPGDFEAQWNFTTDKFATDEDSFEQVGCIHSTQGLKFDYVGVIIGKDLQYKDNIVVTDYGERYLKRDKSIANVKTNEDRLIADRIIRNTYKTILSRGQKGCFVYCEDPNLSAYLKQRLDCVRKVENSL